MKKIYRILIAFATMFAALFVGAIIQIYIKERFRIFISIAVVSFIAVFIGYFVYRLLKPTQKELIKSTPYTELKHENGVIKARGKVFDGKEIGEWEYFDEQGLYIETKDFGSLV